MSATGSVNLIVCFSSSRSFARTPPSPIGPKNLRRHRFPRPAFVRPGQALLIFFAVCFAARPRRPDLPRRLRNPWNLPAQRELAEAQAADAELAQKCARASAQIA